MSRIQSALAATVMGCSGDDDGVPFIDEAVKDIDEALDVFEVEADGGFLDEVEVALAEGGVVEGGF
jgi:coenzyme F420-reducing hydrogenase gamma subunit